jgi:hypothetical protein
MRFQTILVSREDRYGLERDEETGKPALSIPVSNMLTDYSEYYWISESEFESFMVDKGAAAAFAARCGRREMDDRLVFRPGSDRGVY